MSIIIHTKDFYRRRILMSRDNNTKNIKKKIIGCFCFAVVAAGAVLAPAAIFSPNTGLTAGADTTTGSSSSSPSQSYTAEIKLNELLTNFIAYKNNPFPSNDFNYPNGVKKIERASYSDGTTSYPLNIYEITLDSGIYKITGTNTVNTGNVDVKFVVESGKDVTIEFDNVTIINDDGEYTRSGGFGFEYYNKKPLDAKNHNNCYAHSFAVPFNVKDGGSLEVTGTLRMETPVIVGWCVSNNNNTNIAHEYDVPIKEGGGTFTTDFTEFTYSDGAENGKNFGSYYKCKKEENKSAYKDNYDAYQTIYYEVKTITLRPNHDDTDGDGICNNCGKSSSGGGSSSSTPSRPSRPVTPPAPKPIIGGKETSWSEIAKEISSLEEGSEYRIELNGITEIPENVIEAIAKKKIKTTFVVGISRQFYVDGADISEPCAADLTMDYSNDMKADELRGIVGVRFTIHDTNIPTDVNIIFKEEHAGKFANLYKEQDGKAVFVGTAKISDDGKVVLTGIKDAGDYVVMICEFSDLPGDMDNDGILSAKDALAVLKHSAGAENGVNPLFADINGDGFINSKDALAILKISAGLV